MEIPKQGYDDDDDVTEEEEEYVGTVATPPRYFLDTQYGICWDSEQLMIGDSPVFITPMTISKLRGPRSDGRRIRGNC